MDGLVQGAVVLAAGDVTSSFSTSERYSEGGVLGAPRGRGGAIIIIIVVVVVVVVVIVVAVAIVAVAVVVGVATYLPASRPCAMAVCRLCRSICPVQHALSERSGGCKARSPSSSMM